MINKQVYRLKDTFLHLVKSSSCCSFKILAIVLVLFFLQEHTEKEDMLNALLSNTLPELQTKLCAAGMSSMAAMDRIYQLGMRQVHWCLCKREAQPAVVILANLVTICNNFYELHTF